MQRTALRAIAAGGFLCVSLIGTIASAQQIPGMPSQDQIQQMMNSFGSQMPQGTQQPQIPQGMQQGPQGMPNGFGPPAGIEDMQKKGEGMMQKGFNQLKRSTGNMKKGIAQMEKAIANVQKAGYGVDPTVTNSVTKAKAAVATIENGTSMTEEVQNALDAFNDFIDVLNDNIESMNMLANFPRILKQADREIKNVEKAYAKSKSALSKTDFDLTEAYKTVDDKVAALHAAYDKANDFAKNGKGEDAFATLENDFFESVGETRQSIGMLDAVRNLSRSVKSVEKGIASAEKIIQKAGTKGLDTTGLKDVVAQSKAKLAELKTALKQKNFEPDDAVGILEDLNDLRAEFENTLDELTGGDSSQEDSDKGGKNGGENNNGFNRNSFAPLNFFGGQMPKGPDAMFKGAMGGGQGGNMMKPMEKFDF